MPKQKNSYLFDTNALIYWVHKEAPYHSDVTRLMETLLEKDCSLLALASSLSDIYYALCRNYTTEEIARNSILIIAKNFDLIDLAGSFVFEAIESDEPDYEDGLIRAAAKALEVDAIISYNKRAFEHSYIPRLTAQEALRELE